MKWQDRDAKKRAYQIQAVITLSEGEQVAAVSTAAGMFVVGSIPRAHTDARLAGILTRVSDINAAREWFTRAYGV